MGTSEVPHQVARRDVAISANDELSTLASGLPLHHVSQLAVDITLRSVLTARSLPCLGAATTDGSVLQRARRDKERKYLESFEGERCRFFVEAGKLEGGGALRPWTW